MEIIIIWKTRPEVGASVLRDGAQLGEKKCAKGEEILAWRVRQPYVPASDE